VGMAAIMAAKIIGCKTIVGIDIVSSRLSLAKEIGATAVINSLDSGIDLGAEVKKLFNGIGPSVTIDATGNTAIAVSALQFTAPLGRLVLVGVPQRGAALPIDLAQLMSSGKEVLSSVEGNAIPSEFVPRMIKWHKEGKFPIEKLVKYFEAADFPLALAGMKDGSVIKPVLVW